MPHIILYQAIVRKRHPSRDKQICLGDCEAYARQFRLLVAGMFVNTIDVVDFVRHTRLMNLTMTLSKSQTSQPRIQPLRAMSRFALRTARTESGSVSTWDHVQNATTGPLPV